MEANDVPQFTPRKRKVDTLTRDAFIRHWIQFGTQPDDPYLRYLAKKSFAEDPVCADLRTEEVADRMWRIRCDRVQLVKILRSPKKIAAGLDEMNEWRRGRGKYSVPGCEPPYSAYMFGKLLEGAIGCLTNSSGEIEL